MMKHVYEIIDQLRNTQGSKAKLEILKWHSADADLRDFLFFVYEPTISYYQQAIKPMNPSLNAITDSPKPVFNRELLDKIKYNLADRHITGNTAANWLATLNADFQNDWERELLLMLIDRDIRCGINKTTINKVWQGLISYTPYMRCSLPKDVKLDGFPWDEGVIEEIKYDGLYANIKIWPDMSYEVVSRNGSLFPPEPFLNVANELAYAFHFLYPDFKKEEYLEFQGELLAYENGKLLPREKGNGIFNSILQSGEVPQGLVAYFVCWDFIPASAVAKGGKFDVPRKERLRLLENSFTKRESRSFTKLTEYYVVHSYDEAYNLFISARNRGEEGTILKHPDSIWEDGTSKYQVKMKQETEIELKITGFNEGKGKNASTFGSLVAESEDHLLQVGIPGFTDEMRKKIWDEKEYMLGKIISVRANSVTNPIEEGGKYSLFLPRFVEFRTDKDKADTLQRIKDQFESALKVKK